MTDNWLSVARGGIQYGPGPCPSSAPESGSPCLLLDARVAHVGDRHANHEDGVTWPVGVDDFKRWTVVREPVHVCQWPDEVTTWDRALAEGKDPEDTVWVCPECLQHWDLERDDCYECGRPNDTRWVRRFEWAGAEPSGWFGLLPRENTGTVGPAAVTAAGGWCAPSDDL